MPKKELFGSLFAILSVLVFAFEWWFIRELAIFNLSGFYLLSSLFFTGIAILSFGLFFKKVQNSYPKTGKSWLLTFGLSELIAFSTFFLALLEISVVQTLIWSGLSVFYVILLAPFVLGEKLTIKKILGATLGFLGMIIYISSNQEDFSFSHLGIGDLYAFFCGIFTATSFLIGSKLKDLPMFWKLYFNWIPGALCFTILLLLTPENFYFNNYLEPYFLLLFFGIFISSIFLALFFYQLSVKLIEASKISMYSLLEPIFQGFTAYLIANETLTIGQGFGAILILFGIFTVQRDKEIKNT